MKKEPPHMLELFRYCPQCGSARFLVNDGKSKRCADCGFVFYLNPSAAVAAFISKGKDELLVCVRGREPYRGSLDLPGGFTDVFETAEEALKREIKEELNLEIIRQNYLFSFPNTYAYSGLDIPTMDLFFECEVADFSLMKAGDDVASVQFVPFGEIDESRIGLSSIRKAISFYKQIKQNKL